MGRCRKFHFDGGQVEIAAELVHELDANGKQLRVVKLTDYTAEKVRTLYASLDELRAHACADFVTANSPRSKHSCSMKSTEDFGKCAAKQEVSDEAAIKHDMEEKSREFAEKGAEREQARPISRERTRR